MFNPDEKYDGLIEKEKDIFNDFYQYKREENRVLYPFKKMRHGGTNDFPQYIFLLFKNTEEDYCI
jgi:hypothetical protein